MGHLETSDSYCKLTISHVGCIVMFIYYFSVVVLVVEVVLVVVVVVIVVVIVLLLVLVIIIVVVVVSITGYFSVLVFRLVSVFFPADGPVAGAAEAGLSTAGSGEAALQ